MISAFHIVKNVPCDACGGNHTVAVHVPVLPSVTYQFTCDITGEKASVSGIDADSRTWYEAIPEGALEAEAIDGIR